MLTLHISGLNLVSLLNRGGWRCILQTCCCEFSLSHQSVSCKVCVVGTGRGTCLIKTTSSMFFSSNVKRFPRSFFLGLIKALIFQHDRVRNVIYIERKVKPEAASPSFSRWKTARARFLIDLMHGGTAAVTETLRDTPCLMGEVPSKWNWFVCLGLSVSPPLWLNYLYYLTARSEFEYPFERVWYCGWNLSCRAEA